MQSEYIIRLYVKIFAENQPPIFYVELEELLKVVDGNLVSLQGLVKLADSETSCLSDFKTENQLKGLETLLEFQLRNGLNLISIISNIDMYTSI